MHHQVDVRSRNVIHYRSTCVCVSGCAWIEREHEMYKDANDAIMCRNALIWCNSFRAPHLLLMRSHIHVIIVIIINAHHKTLLASCNMCIVQLNRQSVVCRKLVRCVSHLTCHLHRNKNKNLRKTTDHFTVHRDQSGLAMLSQ